MVVVVWSGGVLHFSGGFLQIFGGLQFFGGEFLQFFGGVPPNFWGVSNFSGGGFLQFFGGGSPPEYGHRSAGTHPTGMHSCSNNISCLSTKLFHQLRNFFPAINAIISKLLFLFRKINEQRCLLFQIELNIFDIKEISVYSVLEIYTILDIFIYVLENDLFLVCGFLQNSMHCMGAPAHCTAV